MEYARNGRGERTWSWELSLAEAKGQTFVCLHCDVRLDVVQMPGLGLDSEVRRRQPRFAEFYFRTARGREHRNCAYEPKRVRAIIEKRIVQRKAGMPGALPVEISFDREIVRDVSKIFPVEDGGRTQTRRRHSDDGSAFGERGDRRTVVSTIERACLAHAGGEALPWLPLRVDGLPATIQTYGKVFCGVERARVGMTRIWYATLRYAQPAVVERERLLLQAFDCEVVVDMSAWTANERSTFVTEVSVCLDWVRDRWRPGGDGPSPRIYALARCGEGDGALIASDPRRICLAVRLKH